MSTASPGLPLRSISMHRKKSGCVIEIGVGRETTVQHTVSIHTSTSDLELLEALQAFLCEATEMRRKSIEDIRAAHT